MSDAAGQIAALDAAAYVQMWRRYGNVITVEQGSGRRPTLWIFFADDSEFPPFDELKRFARTSQDPSWSCAVIDCLIAEATIQ
jgi:hypothetical protein